MAEGIAHNKEESCYRCPDRTAEPNCHMTCEEYLKRAERDKQINRERKKNLNHYMMQYAYSNSNKGRG